MSETENTRIIENGGADGTLNQVQDDNNNVQGNEDVIQDNGNQNDDNNIKQNEFHGAPEEYDFKGIELPEGIKFDETLAEKFNPIAKELNLSQAGANRLVNLLIEHQQEQLGNASEQIAEYERQKQEATILEYSKLTNSDKEIGIDENARNAYMDVADKGYKAFTTPSLQKTMEKSGLIYHPDFIKLFHRLGKMCGNDTINQTSNPVVPAQSPAQILYGNTNDN